ncbi:MAG: glycosyltransferase [Blastocatellia bacterium]|nr:glycosyltransferase [Blastocatellia bacterium]
MKVTVIIPALNEEAAIGKVLKEIPVPPVTEVLVSDNGSTDATASLASELGAKVVFEAEKGYGAACLRALSLIDDRTDIVVFLDADHSDYPEEIPLLIAPIINENIDLVIGSRVRGQSQKGSLTPQQVFGNWLATRLIKLIWRFDYSDLGPFRAVRFESLQKLCMQDRNFGWTVEMQIKAVKQKLSIREVPVSYRKRTGQSKISGTLSGSFKAGCKILYTIAKYGLLTR